MGNSKICNHCIHVRYYGIGDDSMWRCAAPQNMTEEISLVTGTFAYKAKTCEIARNSSSFCGIEGSWHVAKIYSQPGVSGVTADARKFSAKSIDSGSVGDVFSESDLRNNHDAAKKRLEEIKNKKRTGLTGIIPRNL